MHVFVLYVYTKQHEKKPQTGHVFVLICIQYEVYIYTHTYARTLKKGKKNG